VADTGLLRAELIRTLKPLVAACGNVLGFVFNARTALAGIQVTLLAIFVVVYFQPGTLWRELGFWLAVVGTALTVFALVEGRESGI
jgi:hypothetical protein